MRDKKKAGNEVKAEKRSDFKEEEKDVSKYE